MSSSFPFRSIVLLALSVRSGAAWSGALPTLPTVALPAVGIPAVPIPDVAIPVVSIPDVAIPDISGTWDVEWVAANSARVPVLGDSLVLTRQRNIATVTRSGDGFVQHHVPCSLVAESRRSVSTTTFPQGFVDALPEKTYGINLSQVSNGWHYAADLGPQAVGFDRALSPDGLPVEQSDPAVTDWDSDGHPGATVLVWAPLFGSVEVYIVHSAHGILDGQVTVDGDGQPVEIAGTFVLAENSQRTIGAGNRLFHATPALTFQPKQSWFHMVRVDSGATCDIAAADAGRFATQ